MIWFAHAGCLPVSAVPVMVGWRLRHSAFSVWTFRVRLYGRMVKSILPCFRFWRASLRVSLFTARGYANITFRFGDYNGTIFDTTLLSFSWRRTKHIPLSEGHRYGNYFAHFFLCLRCQTRRRDRSPHGTDSARDLHFARKHGRSLSMDVSSTMSGSAARTTSTVALQSSRLATDGVSSSANRQVEPGARRAEELQGIGMMRDRGRVISAQTARTLRCPRTSVHWRLTTNVKCCIYVDRVTGLTGHETSTSSDTMEAREVELSCRDKLTRVTLKRWSRFCAVLNALLRRCLSGVSLECCWSLHFLLRLRPSLSNSPCTSKESRQYRGKDNGGERPAMKHQVAASHHGKPNN